MTWRTIQTRQALKEIRASTSAKERRRKPKTKKKDRR